jgi:hypothetical protein
MKKVTFTFALILLCVIGFSQSSYLYEATPYGSRVAARADLNPITGYTSYSVLNNMGMWEQKATSVPSSFDKGSSTLYYNDIYGSLNIASFSTSNIGAGSTIYSKNNYGGFSPSDIISPNYGGIYSIYSKSDAGSFVPTGYYNSNTGQGYIKSSSIDIPSIYNSSSIYSNTISLPSVPSFSTYSNSIISLPNIKF